MFISAHTRLRLAAWLASAMLIVSLSGCSEIDHSGDSPPLPADILADPAAVQGEFQIWSWGIAAKSLKEVMPLFYAKYPNVTASIDMTGPELQSRLFLSLAAGVGAPGVTQMQNREAMRYAATGTLVDLTEVAAKYEQYFPPSFWKNCVYDGRVYAIPWDIGPTAVFYKRDLYRKYGVNPEDIETWDDFIAAGEKMLEASNGETKILQLYAGNSFTFFHTLLNQVGGQAFDDEGRIAIYSEEALQVLDVMRRIMDSGINANIPPYEHEHLASLTIDTIASYAMGVWYGGTIKDIARTDAYEGEKKEWGVYRLPAFEPGGLRTSNMGGSVLAITQQCEDKAAAWAFIEQALCTKEGQLTMYKEYDIFPSFSPAREDPSFNQPDPFYENQNVANLFSMDLDKIPPVNRTVNWSLMESYMIQALSRWRAEGLEDDHAFLADIEKKLAMRTGREISPMSLSRRGATAQVAEAE